MSDTFRDPLSGEWLALRVTQALGGSGLPGPLAWALETELGRTPVAGGALARGGCGPAEFAAAVGEALTELAARAERAARPESRVYLAVVTHADQGHWHKGATPEAAAIAARRQGGLRKNARARTRVYRVHPATAVLSDGGFRYPGGHPPELVADEPAVARRALSAPCPTPDTEPSMDLSDVIRRLEGSAGSLARAADTGGLSAAEAHELATKLTAQVRDLVRQVLNEEDEEDEE